MKEYYFQKSKNLEFGIQIFNNIDNNEITEIDLQTEGL